MSNEFYFFELLLQRLEKRFDLFAYNHISKSTENNFFISDLLAETDYYLCFAHTWLASNQTFTNRWLLSPLLQNKLLTKGITNLYSYQTDAIKEILANNNVIITAPTGNGKTESFLLPVLHKILAWKDQGIEGIKCIIFYPTKALASDQLAKINYFTKELDIKSVQLDSDVAKKDRDIIYQNKQYDLLITTPDLIHYSLRTKEFRNFIATTKIIVLDEVHTYTGAFGTHVYYFLRRLERILKIGPNIQYIAASATIGNPVDFTSKLFAKTMVQVNCSTPKKNTTELYCIQRHKQTNKLDALFQLVSMLTQLLNNEKILIFRNSQQDCEKTYEKLRLIKNKRIALHRAGLTKDQRTSIEKQLRDSELDVVVTTTTLEVGIDIGGITIVITPIVPVNRLIQRIGRAGRGDQPAKIFLELDHDPIAYYYSAHANAYLQDISPVNITTENKSIASQHGALLIQERDNLTTLDKEIFGKISNRPGKIFSLRNVAEKIVVRTDRGYTVTEKELPQSFYEFFPLNHILNNGNHYQVEKIIKTNKNEITAIVRQLKEKFDYKQKIQPIVTSKVFTNSASRKIEFIDDIEVKLANCKIELEYKGNRINYNDQILLDSYTYEYYSNCVIFNFEDKMGEYITQERREGVELGSLVHSLSHVLYKSAKMIIHCGNDLLNMENNIDKWKVIFVDNAINSNGMSELLFEKMEEIWTRALEMLHDCDCKAKEGCLKCTMDYGCQKRNNGLMKLQK